MMGPWGNGAFNPAQLTNPLQFYLGGLEAMSQSAGPFMGPMKAMARCQLEAMGFASRRAQAYMELPSRLSRCRTPQDMVSEQARFWQLAFQQYSETSRKMMEAWVQATPMVAMPSRNERTRDYISFADPREANGHARSARDRHAA